MDENQRNMTLTECVKTEHKECAKLEMIMIPYFCACKAEKSQLHLFIQYAAIG